MNAALLLVLAAGVAGLAYYAYYHKGGVGQIARKRGTARAEDNDARGYEKTIPLSGVCGVCLKNVQMPFRCSYCHKLFCDDHRLPEDHDCEGL